MSRSKNLDARASSAKQDWQTPPELFALLTSAFEFDTDVAASPANALCGQFYSEANSALAQTWRGKSLWCNPPYNNQEPFLKKAVEEVANQRKTVLFLIPAAPDTKRWQELIFPFASAICWIKGRITFHDNGVPAKAGGFFPSALVAFGLINQHQLAVLKQLGYTTTNA